MHKDYRTNADKSTSVIFIHNFSMMVLMWSAQNNVYITSLRVITIGLLGYMVTLGT